MTSNIITITVHNKRVHLVTHQPITKIVDRVLRDGWQQKPIKGFSY